MHTSVRPFATAGAALVGASAIAISPLVATPSLPDVKVANPAVHLSAAVDPIEAWLQVFDTSSLNLGNLADAWMQAPAPVLQQVIANQLGYLAELPDVEAIAGQIGSNVQAALTALFAEDLSTLDSTHSDVYGLLLNGLPPILPPVVPADLAPLVQFSTSYLSGVLLGVVGPVIGPVLALAAGANAIAAHLGGANPDLEAALNTLVNTPADMADAFLNGGQSVDITPLLKAVGLESPLPGLDFGARLVFGGVLSPGGSIFNAMSIDLGDGSGPTGVGPGAIGSLIGLSQAIAKAIGWDGTGSPLDPPATPQSSNLRELSDASVNASQAVTVQTVSAGDTTIDEPATDDEAGESVATTPAVSPPVSDTADTADTADEATEDAGEAAEPSADDAAPASEETDGASTTKADVKRNNAGARIAGAVKSATDRLDSIGAKLRNGSGKTAKAPAGKADSSESAGASKTSGSDSE
ncbi:hypothetical protein NIIDNTM18_08450 [Mycolicibacterium litorale]|uniref:PE-PGRS family protein n=1 Tax=Mycolicibacterium litorale TaxID=758802 RepID=A0A6S6P2J9_9MYCO|nr:outer membrane porin GjpA [Mycolicibacterium litorale]BCI51567.1 hypothetical protein NIIDNTM18_08450 [Mycolicibacterium litorale]